MAAISAFRQSPWASTHLDGSGQWIQDEDGVLNGQSATRSRFLDAAPAPAASASPSGQALASSTGAATPHERTSEEWARIAGTWNTYHEADPYRLMQQMCEFNWDAADIAQATGQTAQQVGAYLTAQGAPAGFGGAVTTGQSLAQPTSSIGRLVAAARPTAGTRLQAYLGYMKMNTLQQAAMRAMVDTPANQELLRVFGGGNTQLPNTEMGERMRALYGTELGTQLARLTVATDAMRKYYKDALDAAMHPPKAAVAYVDESGVAHDESGNVVPLKAPPFDGAAFHNAFISRDTPQSRVIGMIYGQATNTTRTSNQSIYETSGTLDKMRMVIGIDDGMDSIGSPTVATDLSKVGLARVGLDGTAELYDHSQVFYEPMIGFVTPEANIKPPEPGLIDKIAPMIVVALVSYVSAGTLGPMAAGAMGLTGTAATVASAAIAGAATSMASGMISGNVTFKGILQGALSGALTAGLFSGVESLSGTSISSMGAMGSIAARTTVQGAVQALMGGSFRDGAIAGFASGLGQALSAQLNANIMKAADAGTMTASEVTQARHFANMVGESIRIVASGSSNPGYALASAFLTQTLGALMPPGAAPAPVETVAAAAEPASPATAPEVSPAPASNAAEAPAPAPPAASAFAGTLDPTGLQSSGTASELADGFWGEVGGRDLLASAATTQVVTTQEGDSWARLAREHYGDERYALALAQANGAKNTLLKAGAEVRLPVLTGANLQAGGRLLADDASLRVRAAQAAQAAAQAQAQAQAQADWQWQVASTAQASGTDGATPSPLAQNLGGPQPISFTGGPVEDPLTLLGSGAGTPSRPREEAGLLSRETLAVPFAAVGNTVDRFVSGGAGGLATLFGQTDDADRIFREMDERVATRNQWANPQGKSQTFAGQLAGTVATLPMQLLSLPMSPAETGQDLIRNGEQLSTAVEGTLLRTAGNMAALALPGSLGSSLLGKAVSGAAINVGQDELVSRGIVALSETDATQEQFTPTWESRAQGATLGAFFGALHAHGADPAAPAGERPAIGTSVWSLLPEGQGLQPTQPLVDVDGVFMPASEAPRPARLSGPEPVSTAVTPPSSTLPAVSVTAAAAEAVPVFYRPDQPATVNGQPEVLAHDTPVYRVQMPDLPLAPHPSPFFDPSAYGLPLNEPWDAMYVATDPVALAQLRAQQNYFADGAQMHSAPVGQLVEASGPGTRVFTDEKMNMSVLGTDSGGYVIVRPRFNTQDALDNPRIEHLDPEAAYDYAKSFLNHQSRDGVAPTPGSAGAALTDGLQRIFTDVARYEDGDFGRVLRNPEEVAARVQDLMAQRRVPPDGASPVALAQDRPAGSIVPRGQQGAIDLGAWATAAQSAFRLLAGRPQPGRFASADEAARAAAREFFPTSDQRGLEYGGFIYQVPGFSGEATFDFTTTVGKGSSVTLSKKDVPKTARIVADWHTHPGLTTPSFSTADIISYHAAPVDDNTPQDYVGYVANAEGLQAYSVGKQQVRVVDGTMRTVEGLDRLKSRDVFLEDVDRMIEELRGVGFRWVATGEPSINIAAAGALSRPDYASRPDPFQTHAGLIYDYGEKRPHGFSTTPAYALDDQGNWLAGQGEQPAGGLPPGARERGRFVIRPTILGTLDALEHESFFPHEIQQAHQSAAALGLKDYRLYLRTPRSAYKVYSTASGAVSTLKDGYVALLPGYEASLRTGSHDAAPVRSLFKDSGQAFDQALGRARDKATREAPGAIGEGGDAPSVQGMRALETLAQQLEAAKDAAPRVPAWVLSALVGQVKREVAEIEGRRDRLGDAERGALYQALNDRVALSLRLFDAGWHFADDEMDALESGVDLLRQVTRQTRQPAELALVAWPNFSHSYLPPQLVPPFAQVVGRLRAAVHPGSASGVDVVYDRVPAEASATWQPEGARQGMTQQDLQGLIDARRFTPPSEAPLPDVPVIQRHAWDTVASASDPNSDDVYLYRGDTHRRTRFPSSMAEREGSVQAVAERLAGMDEVTLRYFARMHEASAVGETLSGSPFVSLTASRAEAESSATQHGAGWVSVFRIPRAEREALTLQPVSRDPDKHLARGGIPEKYLVAQYPYSEEERIGDVVRDDLHKAVGAVRAPDSEAVRAALQQQLGRILFFDQDSTRVDFVGRSPDAPTHLRFAIHGVLDRSEEERWDASYMAVVDTTSGAWRVDRWEGPAPAAVAEVVAWPGFDTLPASSPAVDGPDLSPDLSPAAAGASARRAVRDEFRYWLDGENGVTAQLQDGTLALNIRAGGRIRGSALIDKVMAHFGPRVERVSGHWVSQSPDANNKNLGTVNRLTAEGMPLAQAVMQAWTAQQAARHGFTHLNLLLHRGSPGQYRKILVEFGR